MSLRCYTKRLILPLSGLLVFAIAYSVTAQDVDPDLPSAEEVIDKYILAQGGYEILSSISTSHAIWTKSDEKGVEKFERWRIPGRKYTERTRNGELYCTRGSWVANRLATPASIQGVSWYVYKGNFQLYSGDKLKEDLLGSADIDGSTRWRERCKSAVCKSIQEVNGKKCYLLEFENWDGRTIKRYFDVDSGYLLRKIGFEHYSGRLVTRDYFDYKLFAGIAMPLRQTITSENGSVDIWKLKSFEHDLELDFDEFPVPDAAEMAIRKMEARIAVAANETQDSR